jgi:hypothetical protein
MKEINNIRLVLCVVMLCAFGTLQAQVMANKARLIAREPFVQLNGDLLSSVI